MYDANIACRKLASQHPILMLRYIVLQDQELDCMLYIQKSKCVCTSLIFVFYIFVFIRLCLKCLMETFHFRQLPLIAALLKGKTQFTFGEMRHKNYLLLFTHVLGLMETLQPHIYRRDYSAMADIIDSYFSLIGVSPHFVCCLKHTTSYFRILGFPLIILLLNLIIMYQVLFLYIVS